MLHRCWVCGDLAEFPDDAPWGPDYVCKEHHGAEVCPDVPN